MSQAIVTGAQYFKATRLFTAAELKTLDTPVSLELAPAVPGKSIVPVQFSQQFNFQTTEWTLGEGAAAFAYYGNVNTGLKVFSNELVAAMIGSMTQSQFYNSSTLVAPTAGISDVTKTEGLGLYLIETVTGFNVAGDGTLEIVVYYGLV